MPASIGMLSWSGGEGLNTYRGLHEQVSAYCQIKEYMNSRCLPSDQREVFRLPMFSIQRSPLPVTRIAIYSSLTSSLAKLRLLLCPTLVSPVQLGFCVHGHRIFARLPTAFASRFAFPTPIRPGWDRRPSEQSVRNVYKGYPRVRSLGCSDGLVSYW